MQVVDIILGGVRGKTCKECKGITQCSILRDIPTEVIPGPMGEEEEEMTVIIMGTMGETGRKEQDSRRTQEDLIPIYFR